MNDVFYIVLCVLLYTQSALQSCGGGSLLNHYQCAASTWMMWRQPQYNGASALTTHQLQVERRERVIEPIKWLGVIRRPWLTRDSSGNLARTPGLHPYSLWEVSWDLKWPQKFTNVAYVDPNMESIFDFNNLRFSPEMLWHIFCN